LQTFVGRMRWSLRRLDLPELRLSRLAIPSPALMS